MRGRSATFSCELRGRLQIVRLYHGLSCERPETEVENETKKPRNPKQTTEKRNCTLNRQCRIHNTKRKLAKPEDIHSFIIQTTTNYPETELDFRHPSTYTNNFDQRLPIMILDYYNSQTNFFYLLYNHNFLCHGGRRRKILGRTKEQRNSGV